MTMADELVYRLRGQRTNGRICEQAADEIERLQRMAMTLIDELRQNGGYEAYTPKMLFQEFYEEAHRGDR